VSAICFYMYKAKNMNGRRNIFTLSLNPNAKPKP